MSLPIRISVVTSSFNGARFLPACLESVRRAANNVSGKVSVEHVVIDAGSRDGSIKLLEDWSARIIKDQLSAINFEFTFHSEPDRGQCDGFNKGVARTAGEWLCWLNADDELASESFMAFLRTLKHNPKADVTYGHVQFIDEGSNPLWISYHLPFFYGLTLYGCHMPPSSGTIFRRELFVREPLDIEYHFVMDTEWFLRCGERIKAVLADEVLSRFRISDDAKTSEMIRSGKVTERHALEREMYRRKHVYSRWPELTEAEAERRFTKRRKLWLVFYYLLKLRYAGRYLKQRLGQ